MYCDMLTRILRRCTRKASTATVVEKSSKRKEGPIMIMPRSEEEKERFRKRITVTLLGCNNLLGHITATNLKLKCKDLKELRLWDNEGTLRGIALELSHLPTAPRVIPYIGKGHLQMALRTSDVVMIMGGNSGFPREPVSELFARNLSFVRELASAIIINAPKALVGVCVSPIMPNLSFIGMLQKLQGTFSPNKLFGVMSLDEMRARTLAAVKLGLPPGTVKIILTGGATADTVVPVISSAEPGGEFLEPDMVELMNLLRNMTEVMKENGRKAHLSGGHATANFIMALAQGLCTDSPANLSAAVRNCALFGVPYLTLPVTVGDGGIVGTTGIPRLTSMELKALIRALPQIEEYIALGEKAAVQESAPEEILDLYQ